VAKPPLVFVLNGPNLNMLGLRQPKVYGRATLADVEKLCRERAEGLGLAVDFRQTNHEGELVGWIQEARRAAAGIIINAGAYTHTSVAVLDALLTAEKPVIEVHISNVFAREELRHRSYVAPVARASLCGFGVNGYALAIVGLAAMIGATAKS
jgi:3-dehydroquinate dehydratase-2